MQCADCQSTLPDDQLVCPMCGFRNVQAADNVVTGNPGQSPESQKKDRLRQYYEALLGYKNPEFYIPKFERFDAGGSSLSWNWPAFFVTTYWLLYRKMWMLAIVYILAPMVISIAVTIALSIALAANPDAGATLGIFVLVLLLLAIVLIPLYANKAYHMVLRSKLDKVVGYTADHDRRLKLLEQKGGTSYLAIAAILLMIVPLSILLAIAVPAYQDYTQRAVVADAMSHAAPMKLRVIEHVYEQQTWPEADAEYFSDLTDPASGFGYQLGAQGLIIIQLDDELLDSSGTLYLDPLYDEQTETFSWHCSTDLPASNVPAECRGN